MNRTEALNILGLDDDASAADIKSAYRECVQILHPDRFANNKKLQDRATEQFKRLQDAYEYLTSDRAASKQSRSSSRPRQAYTAREAKIAGLEAARTQLIAHFYGRGRFGPQVGKRDLCQFRQHALCRDLFQSIPSFWQGWQPPPGFVPASAAGPFGNICIIAQQPQVVNRIL